MPIDTNVLTPEKQQQAGHYEVLGETYVAFELFENGWNPYSRFLDVDKVDFILRKLHENKPIYPVALVPQGPRLQCSEALGFAHFHPSELSLPRVVGGRTDIMRRTHRLYRAPGLRLLQYPNDLFLAESTPLDLLLFL